MKNVKVINRRTGKVDSWDAKNVKSLPTTEAIEKMRNHKNSELFSFIIEFKGLDYNMGWYSVNDYDLVVE